MSWVVRQSVEVETDGDGDATAYLGPFTGQLINIVYTKDDYAAGVDFSVTAEQSGLELWVQNDVNASAVVSPRQPLHSQAGVGLVYTTDNKPVCGPIYLAQERIKIVVADGGATKAGTFTAIVAGHAY